MNSSCNLYMSYVKDAFKWKKSADQSKRIQDPFTAFVQYTTSKKWLEIAGVVPTSICNTKSNTYTAKCKEMQEDQCGTIEKKIIELDELMSETKSSIQRTMEEGEDDIDCKTVDQLIMGGECLLFGDIIGMDDVKENFMNGIVNPLLYPSLFPNMSQGILLYGPPGGGKTQIMKSVAREIELRGARKGIKVIFFSPTGAELKGKYVGETEKRIRRLWACAQRAANCCQDGKSNVVSIIFIDEIDSIAGSRANDQSGFMANSVNTLLQMMDGLAAYPNVVTVAATNLPWQLDSAVLRRFKDQYYVGPSTAADKADIISMLICQYVNRTIKPKNVSGEQRRETTVAKCDLKSETTKALTGATSATWTCGIGECDDETLDRKRIIGKCLDESNWEQYPFIDTGLLNKEQLIEFTQNLDLYSNSDIHAVYVYVTQTMADLALSRGLFHLQVVDDNTLIYVSDNSNYELYTKKGDKWTSDTKDSKNIDFISDYFSSPDTYPLRYVVDHPDVPVIEMQPPVVAYFPDIAFNWSGDPDEMRKKLLEKLKGRARDVKKQMFIEVTVTPKAANVYDSPVLNTSAKTYDIMDDVYTGTDAWGDRKIEFKITNDTSTNGRMLEGYLNRVTVSDDTIDSNDIIFVSAPDDMLPPLDDRDVHTSAQMMYKLRMYIEKLNNDKQYNFVGRFAFETLNVLNSDNFDSHSKHFANYNYKFLNLKYLPRKYFKSDMSVVDLVNTGYDIYSNMTNVFLYKYNVEIINNLTQESKTETIIGEIKWKENAIASMKEYTSQGIAPLTRLLYITKRFYVVGDANPIPFEYSGGELDIQAKKFHNLYLRNNMKLEVPAYAYDRVLFDVPLMWLTIRNGITVKSNTTNLNYKAFKTRANVSVVDARKVVLIDKDSVLDGSYKNDLKTIVASDKPEIVPQVAPSKPKQFALVSFAKSAWSGLSAFASNIFTSDTFENADDFDQDGYQQAYDQAESDGDTHPKFSTEEYNAQLKLVSAILENYDLANTRKVDIAMLRTFGFSRELFNEAINNKIPGYIAPSLNQDEVNSLNKYSSTGEMPSVMSKNK